MKHLFIINGKTNRKRTRALEASIKEQFKGEPYEIYYTKKANDASNKAKEEISKSHDLRIYSCGGDGTLHEVINGVYPHKDVEVACLPMGTGNDFVKSFNVSMEDFLNLKNYQNPYKIYADLIKTGDEVSINTVSVGFDAKVSDRVKYFSWIPGFKGTLPYYCAVLLSLIKPLGTTYQFKIDKKKYEDSYTFLVVTNGKYYGGGYQPCPDASVNDGIMNYCLIKEVKRKAVFKLAVVYKQGNHYPLTDICEHGILDTFEMTDGKEHLYSLDGESRIMTNCKAELLIRQIKFCLPNKD